MSGMSPGDLDTPALLQVATDTVTGQGGRSRAWATVSVIWIALRPEAGQEVCPPGLPPRRRDLASATARDNPALARGTRLVIGSEPPWQVTGARHRLPARGYVTLSLERET